MLVSPDAVHSMPIMRPCRTQHLVLAFCSLLAALLPSPLLAQDEVLPADMAQVYTFCERSHDLLYTQLEEASRYAQKALALAQDLNFQRGIGASLNALGDVEYVDGDIAEAHNYYTQAREVYEEVGGEHGLATTFGNLGNVYWRQENLQQALTLHLRALKVFERLGDKKEIAISLNNIGVVHVDQGNLDEALTYYSRSAALSTSLNDRGRLIRTLSNMGSVYSQQDAYDKAHEHLQDALDIAKELGDRGHMAFIYNNIGYLLAKQDRHERAVEVLSEAVRLSRAAGNNRLLMFIHDGLSRSYHGLGQYDRALEHAHQSLTLAQEMDSNRRQMEAHLSLSKIHEAAGNYEQALTHHQHYVAAKDSVFNAEKTRIVAQMQTRYETEEKKQMIEVLQQESRIQALQAERWRNRMIAGVGVLLLFSGFLFGRYRLKQRSNRLLEAKNEEIEAQREALERSLAEKKVLLREVHHRVKNNLQVISSLLNLQADAIDDPSALAALRDTQSRVQAMALIHRKLHRKEDLPRIDMQTYIEGLSDFLLRAFNGKAKAVDCNVCVPNLHLNADTAIPLGLILNELLSNALEHAFPNGTEGTIRVTMQEYAPNRYELEVTDDGRGFSTSPLTPSSSGLGFQLVKKLTRQLEGALQVDSGPDGTRYTLRFTETAMS